MQRQVITDGSLLCGLVAGKTGALDSAQGCGRAAQPGVAQAGIIVVQFPDGKGICRFTRKEIVQIFFVRYFLEPELRQETIIQSPADIIMAAQVILEHTVAGQTGQNIKLAAQQRRISGRHGMPGAGHGRHIVQNMALRLVGRAEVGGQFVRLHDHLTEQ